MGNKKNKNKKSKTKSNNWRGIIRMRKPKPTGNGGYSDEREHDRNDDCLNRKTRFEKSASHDGRNEFQKMSENQPNVIDTSTEMLHHNSDEEITENVFMEKLQAEAVVKVVECDTYYDIGESDNEVANLSENQPSIITNENFDHFIEILEEAELSEHQPSITISESLDIFDENANANIIMMGRSETQTRRASSDDESVTIVPENQPNLPVVIDIEITEVTDLSEFEISTASSIIVCNQWKDFLHDANDNNIETENVLANSADEENQPIDEIQESFGSDIQNISVDNDVQSKVQRTDSDGQILKELSGRRIVDIKSFFEQIRELHHSDTCHVEDMICTDEVKKGLLSTFKFKCTVCSHEKKIHSYNHGDPVDLNNAAVLGITSVGLGAYHLNEFCTNLEVPCMTDYLYDKTQKKQQEHWWHLAKESALIALKEEIRLAILHGDVDSNGNALIVIVCDGSWAKRSYNTNFTSLSGCAVMIGVRTNKIAHFDVKDKYCHVCKIAESKKVESRAHECNKNFVGPSSSMETAIIIEGFQFCENLGARFKEYIADGDSSTYKNLCDLKIYQNPEMPVEKNECCNHVYRNFRTAFGKLGKNTKKSKTVSHKLLTKKKGIENV